MNKLPWLKHMHDSHRDLWMRDMIRKHGHHFHTLYWTILELIHMHGVSGKLKISIKELSQTSMIRTSKLQTCLDDEGAKRKMFVHSDGDHLEIEIKNYQEIQHKLKSKSLSNAAETGIDIEEEEDRDKEEDKPPISPLNKVEAVSSYPDDFEIFWNAYPRREGKGTALKAWKKLKPNAETKNLILLALGWQKKQDAWTKDDGKFVPHPATWINARRWEDDRKQPSSDFSKPSPGKYAGI